MPRSPDRGQVVGGTALILMRRVPDAFSPAAWRRSFRGQQQVDPVRIIRVEEMRDQPGQAVAVHVVELRGVAQTGQAVSQPTPPIEQPAGNAAMRRGEPVGAKLCAGEIEQQVVRRDRIRLAVNLHE